MILEKIGSDGLAQLSYILGDGDEAIVIDPRRTETAALAVLHLQVRPGTDAWLLTAILGIPQIIACSTRSLHHRCASSRRSASHISA